MKAAGDDYCREGRGLRRRLALRWAPLLVCCAAITFPAQAAQPESVTSLLAAGERIDGGRRRHAHGSAVSQQAVGERIYREGLAPSGRKIRAALPGGMPLAPGQAACINCHRRSGMGGIEGQTLVPPVSGAALYRPGKESFQAFGKRFPRMARRAAYDDITLARAIRQGIDPDGRAIAAPMPRYRLDDREMAALIAYLQSLGASAEPGVSEYEIHFATVTSDDVPAARRSAMREVLQAYFDDRNAGSLSSSRWSAAGEWVIEPRRQWRLHVWELTGPPATWGQQLAAHYRRQPVFAALGGIASGSWQPIHDFCEERRLPCFFPSTDLPPAAAGAYSLYLSRGVVMEAEALVEYLRANPPADALQQVYARGDANSSQAAAALRDALRRNDMPAPEDHPLDALPDAAFWERALRGKTGVSLVIWLDRLDDPWLVPWAESLDRVMVSSNLMNGLPRVPPGLAGKVMAVHPFALPEEKVTRLARLHAWLQAKGIHSDEERIQADAYFAANAATVALMGLRDNFSRDYFLERIEDISESSALISTYPRISLGTGQRFASKGAYVIALPAGAERPVVNGWFVP